MKSIDITGCALVYADSKKKNNNFLIYAVLIVATSLIMGMTNFMFLLLLALIPLGFAYWAMHRTTHTKGNSALKEVSANFMFAEDTLRTYVSGVRYIDERYADQCFICMKRDVESISRNEKGTLAIRAHAVQDYVMENGEVLEHATRPNVDITLLITDETWNELSAWFVDCGFSIGQQPGFVYLPIYDEDAYSRDENLAAQEEDEPHERHFTVLPGGANAQSTYYGLNDEETEVPETSENTEPQSNVFEFPGQLVDSESQSDNAEADNEQPPRQ